MTNRLQKIEKAINSMSDDKFNELLNDLGVKEEKQWVPEIGGMYWSIAYIGTVDGDKWFDSKYDRYRLLMNNVFKTEEEAKAQRDFNFEKAKLIKEIEDSSDVIDWEDAMQDKFFILFDEDSKTLKLNSNFIHKNQGTTYATNKEFLKNLIANEPERVKKYLFGKGE